jgi:transposase InsO family protein
MAILHKSRRWADREAKWEVACREMYALRYGLFEFREYLQGCPNVSVFSDHLNLVNGLWKHSNPKIVRWRMFLESMWPFTLKHISGTAQMQTVADSLSRLHIRNLTLQKNEEEKDPNIIRMMERGEGEDDANMFNDATFVHSAQTQTDFLNALHGTAASANVARLPTPQEQSLADNYGIGFDIAEKMGWSVLAERKDPVQLRSQTTRAGLGYKRSRETLVANASLSAAPPATAPSKKISCVHIADWMEDEERSTPNAHDCNFTANVMTRQQSNQQLPATQPKPPAAIIPESLPAAAISASEPLPAAAISVSEPLPAAAISAVESLPAATTSASEPLPAAAIAALRNLLDLSDPSVAIAQQPAAASSQTTPQDFRDATYKVSGGFPMAELLKRAHDDTHPGFITTWRRVIRAVGAQTTSEAAKTKDEVRRYCNACVCCQKLQPARTKLFADIGSIRQRPFTSYAFDVITLSHPDVDGVRYILCCVDSFSRAVELYGLKQANAQSVLLCLIDVLSRWGRAAELRCDNAKAFTSAMVTALLKRTKVKRHLTAPYSHQSNGQVENCNRRIMDVLRTMILDDRLGPNTQAKWSLLLPEVRRVLMTRTVTQHGLTPNDLAYMHCPETETSIFEEEAWLQPLNPEAEQADPEWLVKLRQQHEALIDICDERQNELLEKLADKNEAARGQHQQPTIQVHDFVLLKLTDRPQQKAQPRWAGPYHRFS